MTNEELERAVARLKTLDRSAHYSEARYKDTADAILSLIKSKHT